MTVQLITTFPTATTRTWELTLDAELPTASHDLTADRAQAVADLLARIPGVGAAAVRPHCEGRFLLAQVAVDATSLVDAIERSAAYLRGCSMDAGVGPLILVAARSSTEGS